jgi:hypothetical protein
MCLRPGVLEAGHVVPAFVYRWLKDTAATPYLRTGDDPNLRSQDGWKRHWFCRDCENQIGRFERAFAEDLFPLVVTEQPAPYRHGPWLSRFVASVAWRAVMLISEQESFGFLTPEQRALLPEAFEHWRAFVRGDAATPAVHELHFLPLWIVAEYQGDRALPPNINRYTLRSIEVHMAGRPSEAFVFVKMGPALMLGFIQPPLPEIWQGTRVALGDGQVGGRMATSVQFLDYYNSRAEKMRELQRRRSPRQQQKIKEAYEAYGDRAAGSETFRAMDADVARFGVERVFRHDDRDDTERTTDAPRRD